MRQVILGTFLAVVAVGRLVAQESEIRSNDGSASLNDQVRKLVRHVPGDTPRGRVDVLGHSAGGKEILIVTIGRVLATGAADGPLTQRFPGHPPGLLVVGGVAGERHVTTDVCLALLHSMINLPAAEFDATFGQRILYVVPLLDPDGAARAAAGVYLKSVGNLRVLDDDRDGRKDEDPADDLNGDGRVLEMRLERPSGTWIVDPVDPRRHIEARSDKNERGRYVLAREGRDDDGDGAYNEDGPGGVRIAANFPQGFREHVLENGPYATSEPESLALVEFMRSHRNLEALLVYGPHDNVSNLPESASGETGRRGAPAGKWLAEDRLLLENLAKFWKESAGRGRRPSADDAGSLHVFAYHQRGLLALAVNPFEAYDHGDEIRKTLSATETAPASRSTRELIQRAETRNFDDMFVPWQPFEDAVLGRVEIGGEIPGVRYTANRETVALIAENETRFARHLLSSLSRIEVDEPGVRQLADSVYELTLVIRSAGMLPTATAQGSLIRRAPPIFVELQIAREAILQGTRRTLIDRLPGVVGLQEVRWLVNAPPGSKLRIDIGRVAGQAQSREVVLP